MCIRDRSEGCTAFGLACYEGEISESVVISELQAGHPIICSAVSYTHLDVYKRQSRTFSQEAGGKVVWLEELYIRPEYRCHGLGKEFFRYVDEKIAPEVKRLRLEIEPENLRAKKLYLSLGYEEDVYKRQM